MPQTNGEMAGVAYHDFHSRKHFAFGMPVEEAGIRLTFARLRASLKGMFQLGQLDQMLWTGLPAFNLD